MKPFKINRNSWHYKLNKYVSNDNQNSMEFYWEPHHNNFCAYWRATMFRLLFVLALSSIAGLFLFTAGTAIYINPIEALIVVGSAIAVIASLIGVLSLSHYLDDRKRNRENVPESLFVQRYKTYKSKVCPMVEFKE